MKLVTFVLPALLVSSFAFAQGGAPAGGDAAAPAAAAPKNAKEAKKACKEQANGDKKAFKACLKEWKKGQAK